MSATPDFLTTLLGAFPDLASGTSGSGILGLLNDFSGSIDPNNPLIGLLQLAGIIGQGAVSQEQLDWIQAITDKQKRSIDIGQDPTRLSTQINATTQPLSEALRRNVLEPVQEQLGLQGMATAPTIQQYVSEQALAPYYQSEQQMGEQAALEGLRFPFDARFSFPTFAASGGDPGTTTSTTTDPFASFVDQLFTPGGSLTSALGGSTSGGITDPFTEFMNSLSGGGFPGIGGLTF